jgi:hypothetical protein
MAAHGSVNTQASMDEHVARTGLTVLAPLEEQEDCVVEYVIAAEKHDYLPTSHV